MTAERRDQEVKVYGLPYAVTRTELAELEELAIEGRNAEAMTLARAIVTRDAVCEPSNWYRCPLHHPRGFRAEPCPEPPACTHDVAFGLRCNTPPCVPILTPDDFLTVPVVTDPAMPPDTFVIGSPDHPPRVLMAPVGTAPDEPGWIDVGWTGEWSIGSRGDHEPVLRSLSTEPVTLALAVPLHRPPSKMLPASAPLDVWDTLTGTTAPGSRGPAREAALSALSAACHAAAQQIVVERAERNAHVAALRRAVTNAVSDYVPAPMHPDTHRALMLAEMRREAAFATYEPYVHLMSPQEWDHYIATAQGDA